MTVNVQLRVDCTYMRLRCALADGKALGNETSVSSHSKHFKHFNLARTQFVSFCQNTAFLLDRAFFQFSGVNAHKQNGLIGVAILANKACKNAINASENKRKKVRGGLEKGKVNYKETNDQTKT